MADTTLESLLKRNRRHVASLPPDHFDPVQEGQKPAVVSICCSDSRVPQSGMWDVTDPGWLFSPSTIGNQVLDHYDGERVVDGSVLYPLVYTDTRVAVVVGHTGCGAVTAALETVQGDGGDAPPGVAKWVELLVPIVENGLADDRVDADRTEGLVDQLVEYNVDRQVAGLQDDDDVPDSVDVYGFVYDFQSVYGDDRGRAYLVNANGETDVDALRERVPEDFEAAVDRLL
jgi:carbonic anhydrase